MPGVPVRFGAVVIATSMALLVSRPALEAQAAPATPATSKPATDTPRTSTPATSTPATGTSAPASLPSATSASVTLAAPTTIRLDASRSVGVGTLRLSNTADAATTIALSAGLFIERSTLDTKEPLRGAIVFNPSVVEIPPKGIREVEVKALDVLFEGTADVDIFGPGKIGTLSVLRAPLAVSIADTKPVFRYRTPVALTLRNDSRDPYTLRWMAQNGPHRYCGPPESKPDDPTKPEGPRQEAVRSCGDDTSGWSVVSIPPKDSQTIHLDPPDAWFHRWSLAAHTRDVTLSLAVDDKLPKHIETLAATLQGRWFEYQGWLIFFLLVLGAGFSLIVRHWVPNMQRKRDLKNQVRRVRSKIDGFSDDIDYDVRAVTRVQGRLLDTMRKSTWTILPDYVTVAAQCTQALTMLEKRVDLIEEVDSVYASERVKWQTCPPPSQIDRVEDLLRSALEMLRKAQLTDTELIVLRSTIDHARALTETMGTANDEFGKDLAARLRAMREELRQFEQTASYQALALDLPGFFLMLTHGAPQAGGAGGGAGGGNAPAPSNEPVPGLRHSLVDYNLSALEICRDYIWLVEGSKDQAITDKLHNEVRPSLLQHLSRQSWSELRLARLLLKQFREDSYEAEIWTAIASGDASMYIVQEPIAIRYHQLVQFRIYFRRPELNWSGARELVSPEWEFSDGSRPRGWTISHFFAAPPRASWKWLRLKKSSSADEPVTSTEHVTVNFEGVSNANGGQLERKTGALRLALPLHRDSYDDGKSGTFSELVALAVSIFIPLVSLMTTAREQLAQNPFGGALMIFLLGFSSDALISVFKQRTTPSS